MSNIWYDKLMSRKLTRFWWLEPKETMHEVVFGLYELLRSEQRHHSRQNLHHARLYGNLEMMALDPDNYARVANYEDHITYNLIESAVDTLHAEGVSNKPMPMFMTDGGDWKLQRKAENLSRFIRGEFYRAGIYSREFPMAILDSLVQGTGPIKVFKKHGRPCAERVFVDQLQVDDVEAMSGRPRQLYHHQWANRDSVIAAFAQDDPGMEKKLREAPEARSDSAALRTIADQIHLVEAWHLPSSPDADDGRHVICSETTTVLSEPWKKDDFPFVFLRYKTRPQGFWGKGVSEILSGQQIAINELIWKIHLSLKLSGPKVFVRPGSEINTAHIDNEIWGIIESLEPPHFATFESVPADLFRQFNAEVQNGYSLVGVNMMQARSELPAGIDSGKAMRIYADQKSKRFISFLNNIDEAYMSLARKWVELARECSEDGEEQQTMCKLDNETAKLLRWSDVQLEEDRYFLQVFPTSFLSNTPAGKLADIESLIKVFPQLQEHALTLMDMPDLKAATSLVTSSTEVCKRSLETMLDGGEYIPPEPFMDLPESMRLATQYYLRAKLPPAAAEDDLEKVRQYMLAIADMMRVPETPSNLPGGRQPTPPAEGLVPPPLPGEPGVPGPELLTPPLTQ